MLLVVLERLGPDGPADVVDEDVQAAEALHGRRHDALAIGVLLEVGGQRQHLTALPLGVQQFVDQLGAIHRRHLRAFFEQSLDDAATDALGGAGDQGDFVVESLAHVSLEKNGPAIHTAPREVSSGAYLRPSPSPSPRGRGDWTAMPASKVLRARAVTPSPSGRGLG
ncbi:hypothetical protein D9M69_532580 [compost metagenome]